MKYTSSMNDYIYIYMMLYYIYIYHNPVCLMKYLQPKVRCQCYNVVPQVEIAKLVSITRQIRGFIAEKMS